MIEPPRKVAQALTLQEFEPLFRPQTVAVVGASGKTLAPGNRFIKVLREAGFEGEIYPIHPSEAQIEGLPTYPTLAGTPTPIDYAFVAVAAEKVPSLLSAANGRVRFAQVMSSGFAECEGGRARERDLLKAAQDGGMRLLGPNCMGTHSPRGRLTFVEGGSGTGGGVAVMSQSGGLAIDLLHRSRVRGLAFRAVVSLGNCADLGPNDFLQYFLADPETRVIGAYLEHVLDGRSFFDQLSNAKARKPVVLLKGGRTRQGQRAAASHTGSLADNDQAWQALSKQTGSILVDTLEEFIDALVAFQAYTPRLRAPSGRVVVIGNGGGASILAVDYLARQGLDVSPLNKETARALAELQLPAGASVANPIDVPANVLRKDGGGIAQEILELVAKDQEVESIMVHLNLSALLGYKDIDMLAALIQAIVRVKHVISGRAHISLALRSSGEPESDGRKREAALWAMESGIPTFDELQNQALAIAAVHSYEQFHYSRRSEPAHERAAQA